MLEKGLSVNLSVIWDPGPKGPSEVRTGMRASEQETAVKQWVAEHMNADILRIERQARWRPVWYVDAAQSEKKWRLCVRGDRVDARIGFTLEHEMQLQQLLHQHGLPVPQVHGFIDSPRAYVMDRVEGQERFEDTTPQAERDVVLDSYIKSLAQIHSLDVEPFARAGILRADKPSHSGRVGMQVYEQAYRASKKRPDPFLEFALGWLKRNPLQNRSQESVVLWDTGQFLHSGGEVTAIIDLEIGHIGDPMMDLAGFRMRAREIGFSDFDRLYTVYSKNGGQAVDREAIQHYYFAFALCNQLAFHSALAAPPPGSDYMMNLRWCIETNLYAIEALADILSLELEPVPPLTAQTSSTDIAHTHLVEWLRNFEPHDPGEAHTVRSGFRLARHLQRASQVGIQAEAADRQDLTSLLGQTPVNPQEADAELEAFVIRDGGTHDLALIKLFHRRLVRALSTLGPEGSAIARHYPVEGLEVAEPGQLSSKRSPSL